jgi:hypothetical protein
MLEEEPEGGGPEECLFVVFLFFELGSRALAGWMEFAVHYGSCA